MKTILAVIERLLTTLGFLLWIIFILDVLGILTLWEML